MPRATWWCWLPRHGRAVPARRSAAIVPGRSRSRSGQSVQIRQSLPEPQAARRWGRWWRRYASRRTLGRCQRRLAIVSGWVRCACRCQRHCGRRRSCRVGRCAGVSLYGLVKRAMLARAAALMAHGPADFASARDVRRQWAGQAGSPLLRDLSACVLPDRRRLLYEPTIRLYAGNQRVCVLRWVEFVAQAQLLV